MQETATFQHSLTVRAILPHAQHSTLLAFLSTYSLLCDMSIYESCNPNVLQRIRQ